MKKRKCLKNDYKYLDDTNIENKKMQKEAQKKYENDLKKREELIKSISKENKEIDKKAAVDLMIARILGEVSDENLKRIREEYDYKTKNGNPIFAKHLCDTFSEEDKIYLLMNSKMPGVLCECGFLSNPEEEKNLSNDEYQSKVAFTIYSGLMEFLSI